MERVRPTLDKTYLTERILILISKISFSFKKLKVYAIKYILQTIIFIKSIIFYYYLTDRPNYLGIVCFGSMSLGHLKIFWLHDFPR